MLLTAAALLAAVLWPSHTLSLLRGAPLDGRVAAILVGLTIPVLVWLRPSFLRKRAVRIAIAALLVLKVADAALLTQHGLCATFSTAAPYSTTVLTIPIDEPHGILRSWDVRADRRAEAPACTAIVDRPYDVASSFPAWFLNVTGFAPSPRPAVAMDVRGYMQTRERGLFVLDVDRGMEIGGRVGTQDVSSSDGRPMLAVLDAGIHRLDLHASLPGARWRFVPTFNGRDAFSATTLTTEEPRASDRFATLIGSAEESIVFVLVALWVFSVALEYASSPALLAWMLVSACALAAVGVTGRFERLSVLLLAGAVVIPVAERHRDLRGALMLIGVPWLALIAARSLPQIAHFTTYSNDDWLAYQVAGYRIFMSGFWIEGGTKVFDYQPLYRWITGALHLVFGDSSVGETYWDALCLLFGASVAFVLVDRVSGFRWAVAAAVATLVTFWVGTIWYFVGRGLSEVSAAGWAFLAALVFLRNRAANVRVAVAAGAFAALAFYTRLNHLLFAASLAALLIPVSVPAQWTSAIRELAAVNVKAVAAYLITVATAVALFATRTWWYTGVFSILYGTSLKFNDTGLRITTLGDRAVWGRVWHSLRALVWMNEPPAFDARAVFVVAGVLLSAGALLQLPRFSRLPLSISLVILGASASAFLVHTHNYPGRMSIHLVPFAVAMTTIAGAKLATR